MDFERFSLKGRVAPITGGGGLLGMQHALALGEASATLIVTDIRIESATRVMEQVRKSYGVSAIGLRLDVSDPKNISGVLDQAITYHGGIDILINNAAIDA